MTNTQILNTLTHRAFYESLGQRHQEVFKSFENTTYSAQTSYLFTGSVGIGKTHTSIQLLAKYCIETYPDGFDLTKYQLQPNYIKFVEIFRKLELRNSNNEEIRYNATESLKDVKESPYLIIDDFNTVQTTEYREQLIKDYIYDVLDYRYDNDLTTVITTNRTAQEIKDFFG